MTSGSAGDCTETSHPRRGEMVAPKEMNGVVALHGMAWWRPGLGRVSR